jgi:Nuclease-related domain
MQRRTAAVLRTLDGEGYLVLHDVTLPGWLDSLDHLVIGPTGVWVVASWGRRRLLPGGAPPPATVRGLRGQADAVAERPGAQIVAQYCNFLRLGFDGYRRVRHCAREVATGLSAEIEALGPFRLLTRGDELPVFAFALREEVDSFTVFDVSMAVREGGWQVPAYTFPANRTDLAVLRVVVRRGFNHDTAGLMLRDLKRVLPRLEKQPEPGQGRHQRLPSLADDVTRSG